MSRKYVRALKLKWEKKNETNGHRRVNTFRQNNILQMKFFCSSLEPFSFVFLQSYEYMYIHSTCAHFSTHWLYTIFYFFFLSFSLCFSGSFLLSSQWHLCMYVDKVRIYPQKFSLFQTIVLSLITITLLATSENFYIYFVELDQQKQKKIESKLWNEKD